AVRRGTTDDDPDWGRVPSESRVPSRSSLGLKERGTGDGGGDAAAIPARSPDVEEDNEIFVPPFTGPRVAKGLAIDDIAGHVNETTPLRNQWGYRPEDGEDDAAFKDRIRVVLRDELAKAKAADLLQPAVVYGYFPASGAGTEIVLWEGHTRDH